MKFHIRRNSSTDLKRKYKIISQSNVIKEEDTEEKDNSEEKENQEQDISFKKQSEHVLTMDDNEDENNNEV